MSTDDIGSDFKDEEFWGKWRTSCYRSQTHQHSTFVLSGCFLKPNVLKIKVKLTLSLLTKSFETQHITLLLSSNECVCPCLCQDKTNGFQHVAESPSALNQAVRKQDCYCFYVFAVFPARLASNL